MSDKVTNRLLRLSSGRLTRATDHFSRLFFAILACTAQQFYTDYTADTRQLGYYSAFCARIMARILRPHSAYQRLAVVTNIEKCAVVSTCRTTPLPFQRIRGS